MRTCAPLKCVSTTISAKIAPLRPTAHAFSAAALSVSLHILDQSSSCAVQEQTQSVAGQATQCSVRSHGTCSEEAQQTAIAPCVPLKTCKKLAWALSTVYKRQPNK